MFSVVLIIPVLHAFNSISTFSLNASPFSNGFWQLQQNTPSVVVSPSFSVSLPNSQECSQVVSIIFRTIEEARG
jgi:hypothetical protein